MPGQKTIPLIAPVQDQLHRPTWSVMIPVYNCIQFLPQTLSAVLAQDPGSTEMEIFVVDDCSTDGDVYALVQEMGKGRISYFRQDQNVGSLRNFETCLNLSRGYVVHLLHGDDFPLNGYYQKMEDLLKRYPTAGAACCRIQYIDGAGKITGYQSIEKAEEGILHDWLVKSAARPRLQYCAVSVRREAYEKLGGFYAVSYGEDWEMWTRIAKSYPFVYTPLTLATYRRHLHSISASKKQSLEHIVDIRKVIELIQQHLPLELRESLRIRATRYYARLTMSTAFSVWVRTRDKQNALDQANAAIALAPHVYLYFRYLLLQIRIFLQR